MNLTSSKTDDCCLWTLNSRPRPVSRFVSTLFSRRAQSTSFYPVPQYLRLEEAGNMELQREEEGCEGEKKTGAEGSRAAGKTRKILEEKKGNTRKKLLALFVRRSRVGNDFGKRVGSNYSRLFLFRHRSPNRKAGFFALSIFLPARSEIKPFFLPFFTLSKKVGRKYFLRRVTNFGLGDSAPFFLGK